MKRFLITFALFLTLAIGFIPFSVKAVPPPDDSTTTPGNTTLQNGPGYTLLAPIPLNGSSAPASRVNIGTYLPGLIKLIIAIATGLAVLRIIYGGIEYMTTDAFDGKNEAKNTITNAVLGLLLAISAFVILNTLNPNLVKLNLSLAQQKVGQQLDTNVGATPCSDCVEVDKIAVPQPGPGISCQDPGPCKVKPALSERLFNGTTGVADKFKNLLHLSYLDWQVVGMTPALDPHNPNSCYQAGTCVDIVFAQQQRDPAVIVSYLDKVNNVGGINFQWVVLTLAERNTLRASAALSSYINNIVNDPNSNNPHIHISLP